MALSDKVAVVTGASGGIGAAIAIELSRAGARVVIGARRLGELERVKSDIEKQVEGAKVLVHKTDVTKRDEVKALIAAAKAGFGPVDIMVNNAGTWWSMCMLPLQDDVLMKSTVYNTPHCA